MFPIPRTATPEIQETFRQIRMVLERIMGENNVDFHQRRVINAGDAVQDRDYVTLQQMELRIAQEIEAAELDAAAGGSGGVVTVTPGAVLFGGLGGTPTGNAARLQWSDTSFTLKVEGDIIGATWAGEIIPVNKGGTGLASGTQGGVLAFTATNVLSSSAALALGRLVVGGSPGAPSTVAVLAADPATPADGEVWVTASGVSPSRVIALKARDGGVTQTVASVTF